MGTSKDLFNETVALTDILQNVLNKSKEENKIKDSNLIVVQNFMIKVAKLAIKYILATKQYPFGKFKKFCDLKYSMVRDLMVLVKTDSHI